jgi:hypothetical protein
VSDVKRLRELEAENARLKRMYADLALETAVLHRVGSSAELRRAPAHRRYHSGSSRRHGPRLIHEVRVLRRYPHIHGHHSDAGEDLAAVALKIW